MPQLDRTISGWTQAALLLCAHFVAAKQKDTEPLSPGEFNTLLTNLEGSGRELIDLLEQEKAGGALAELRMAFDLDRLQRLLGRGFLLSMSLEKWTGQGIWILGREDESYPSRLKKRLGEVAPPFLFGCGNTELLGKGGVAIVGSRDIDSEAEEFTRRVARQCAREKLPVISGGARGVDQISMLACIEEQGQVMGVLADSLGKSALSRNAREAISSGEMTLVSPYDPDAGFNVGNAMARNKFIYALADYGLVVSSAHKEGGTWAGAVEQLQRFKNIPLFVRNGDGVPEGNRKLEQLGALPLPHKFEDGDLMSLLQGGMGESLPIQTGDLFEFAAAKKK
jgi:predicted Rossmann fold nucleotide-binding protein DprA/Smf involved in DNA uptake